ncbi:Holliday junction branch migration protein RuvA [Natronosporangium hydrolyticum]|uniref:Holliday junction branch migration complex subunit RuvA n=1 Tax=Natronosporangium hydrolyticum TaxID=2811111 RepID=A0A895YLT3_9ACTN|nr:Holliday junction branch migration protein RuvA [Natronosporangium hydrolyticum]QSB16932.1 Holliday junction branch migration protein RuvA [Natronosporangium hydrolyticum]
MIASVRGRVTEVTGDGAVVEVGGVGLRVHCSPATAAELTPGTDAELATSLVVREESLTLYGFADRDARELFELLQTASGVGPRLALAVLAVHRPDVVRKAIGNGEVGVLTQVPGIGRKGAERLVLELRDKVGPQPVDGPAPAAAPAAWRDQVRTGLIGLGWSSGQADQAVKQVAEQLGAEVPPVPELLRQAIRLLGKMP